MLRSAGDGPGRRNACDGARATWLPFEAPTAMPACYLYILPLPNEDLAKVGISVDPLARVRAFAPRYYECFDLEHSGLVGYDSVAEARRRETALHRRLRAWNATAPLTVPLRAGGHTEWFRGALAILHDEAEADRAAGHLVHLPAGDWWRHRLRQEQAQLYEWIEQYLHDVPAQELPGTALWQGIVDVLDAWPAMGLGVDEVLPDAFQGVYRAYRRAWSAVL